jgi:ornithine decarboxylase
MDNLADIEPAVVSAKIDHWLSTTPAETPFIVIDLDVVREQHRRLAKLFPFADIYYAVKANPNAAVIGALAALGVGFDLASEGEIVRCQTLGVPPAFYSFGNTIKRETDIARAYAHGVRLFAFDSEGELRKLVRGAHHADVFCRLSVPGQGAEWPLTRKFGCHPDKAIELLLRAKSAGMRPVGVSFHVGSQQTDPGAWRTPIEMAKDVFIACARSGLSLDFLNLGGGLPAQYRSPIPSLEQYADTIDAALRKNFGASRPRTIIEPGRHMVADAGLLRARVLLVAQRSTHTKARWVYLDAGRYNGLPETLGERIHYRLRCSNTSEATGPVILAGPTCDSADILYEKAGYRLPLRLAIGDTIDFLSAGAYTASYASVEFNGFSPIRTYCI